MHELPHDLSSGLRLRILGNEDVFEKDQNKCK